MSRYCVRKLTNVDKIEIKSIVDIHLATFEGFFLTFMGKGFLKQMYTSYILHDNSGIYAAFDGEKVVGFLAWSADMSGLYKYMLKHRLLQFAWYSIGAFLRKPNVFIRLLRAFLKPKEAERDEKYIELASIGVRPDYKSCGIGSELIETLKLDTDFSVYSYITLETDAINNTAANRFYVKNMFLIEREFKTREGRLMYEYRHKRTE